MRKLFVTLTRRSILAMTVGLALAAFGQTAGERSRAWVDTQGRTIKAALLNVEGDNVILKLENGTTAKVPLARFSGPDKAYVKDWSARNGKPDPSVASKPLTWPDSVSVNAKDLQIVTGEQNAAAGRFVYQSGSFQFTSNAALSGTVVRDMASDFELVRAFFVQMPWGYQPKPDQGGFFAINLFETQSQYITAGGTENSSWYFNGKFIVVKFATLGLKRVGERFAFDSRTTRPGSMIGGTARLVMNPMTSFTNPWATMGLEEFLEYCAFKNSSFDFTHVERGLKARIEQTRVNGAATDPGRMVEFIKTSWKDRRDDVLELRRQNFLDGLLLVYFFGYLDGDGKGTKLHRFYRELAQKTMGWREYRESGGARPAPRGNPTEYASELNNLVMDGRSEDQLREQIIAKFKGLGIKL
jgi:hypothetical protein